MPSQRPTFFANFLTAFRAHSAAIPSSTAAKNSSTAAAAAASSSQTTASSSAAHASAPRTIHTSTKASTPGATATALGQLVSPRAQTASPLSRRPGSPGYSTSAGTTHHRHQTRRGSDSSSEGFREVLGAEKWYIGGRTAAGDERYFKLGVVKRHRSVDRLSLDRLSL